MSSTLPDIKAILTLYKQLLRYSNSLKYTDKKFYERRIREEFGKHRDLEHPEEINFQYQPSEMAKYFGNLGRSSVVACQMIRPHELSFNFYGGGQILFYSRQMKAKIDFSRVPTLDEKDLEEIYTKGSGPGGSKVNKSVSAVVLIHKPTGIVHKCHDARELHENRKLAREQLIVKLDDHINGDMSIKAQKEKILKKKSIKSEAKNRNMLDMKKKYLELVSSSETETSNENDRCESSSSTFNVNVTNQYKLSKDDT